MNWSVPSLVFLLASVTWGSALMAGDGIDCSKATSKIEIAICNSDALRDKDGQLAETFKLVKEASSLLPEQRSFLIDDQRAWIEARTETCGERPDGDVPKCVDAAISSRQIQLVHEYGLDPDDQDVVKAGHLKVGKVVIPIHRDTDSPDTYFLGANKEDPISETSIGNDEENPLFSVPYRMSRGADEAAILLTGGRGGTMRAHEYDILISGPDTPFKMIEFGECSVVPGQECRMYRGRDGFTLEYPALPSKPKLRIHWNFETGLRTESEPFRPSGPATMSEFLKKPTDEPLNVLELYNLVKSLPKPFSGVLAVSLTRIEQRMELGGQNGALFGQRLTDDFYAISACGLHAEGTALFCDGDPAFFFWDRKTRKAMFATYHDDEDMLKNERPLQSMLFTPPFAGWPDAAKAQFADWQAKKVWEPLD